ncbi:hypothetical protein PIB30_119046 [Stylosanthes scabra]|uniref:Myb/SANT-like domain-containing protein n=1 Tax=Stylosanthes scabra TaxID=79078 RepID=A0ABU6SQ37_9FABA|nr:hypothetical protein [Stylosanthes scabra]
MLSISNEFTVNNALEGSSYSAENETIIHLDKDIGEDDHEVLHDIMVDEDFGISNLEAENDDDSEQRVVKETVTPFSIRTRTYWQPPMDRYFINQMLAHIEKGNRPDGVFSRQAWMEMISTFNEKFGFEYSLEHLKNRYKTLRRQYNLIKNILDLDGFVWDEARQMITADDSAWQDCIKVHPDARQFMTRPLPYYKDLCIICNPKFDKKESSLPQDIIELQNIVDVKIDSDYASPAGHSSITSNPSEEQLGVVKEVAHSGQKQKRQVEKFSGAPSPKRSTNEERSMAVALREMATVVSSLSTEKSDENPVSIETVIRAVQALPDMDEDLILDACDFLEDERKAKLFLALDVKLRKKWLIRKLRTQA